METGRISVIYGTGRGKTTGALGQAIIAASEGESVNIIQFMKGRKEQTIEYIKRLEPEIKLFRFDHSVKGYLELGEEEKREEQIHIKNGLNFARKVMTTEGCDVLILDEFLELIEYQILSVEEARELLGNVGEHQRVILTGVFKCPQLMQLASDVTRIETIHND